MEEYLSEDSVYEYKNNKKLADVIAILDPLSKIEGRELPCGPDNDQRVNILTIMTNFTLQAPTSGAGLLLFYPNAPFGKILEHYTIDVNTGDYVLESIVRTSVNPATNYTWARLIKSLFELRSGYLVTAGGQISAGTQGDISGAQVADGISQLYLPGKTAAQSINYSSISQLQVNQRSKMLASTARDGIAFQAPIDPRQPFVRTNDFAGGATSDDNVDWKESIVVNGEVPFTSNPIPNSLTINTGSITDYTSDSISVDGPFHFEVGANVASNLNLINTNQLGLNEYFGITVEALLYDVTRSGVVATFRLWETGVTFVDNLAAGTSVRLAQRSDGSVLWPINNDDEVHATITAVKYKISLYNLTSSAITVNVTELALICKITLPLFSYQGFAQRPTLVAYQNFSDGSPMSCLSKQIMEVVPDSNLAKIVPAKDRSVSTKQTALLDSALRKMQKFGIGYWYKPNSEARSDSGMQFSHEVNMLVKALAYDILGNKNRMIGELKEHIKNYPVKNGVEPVYSSGFSKFLKGLNKNVLRPTGKALKSVGEEVWNVSKPIVRDFAYTAADGAIQSMLPKMASGAVFSSKPCFASRFPKETKNNNLLVKDKPACKDIEDCYPEPSEKFQAITKKGEYFYVPYNVASLYVPNCTFLKIGRVPPHSAVFLLVEATREIIQEYNKMKNESNRNDFKMPWTILNGKSIIYGHVGPAYEGLRGVNSDLALLKPLRSTEDYIICELNTPGTGDSVLAAAIAISHVKCNMNLAISGGITGNLVLPIEKHIGRWKAQACKEDLLMFIANTEAADIQVTTVQGLINEVTRLYKLSCKVNVPLYMDAIPRRQPKQSPKKSAQLKGPGGAQAASAEKVNKMKPLASYQYSDATFDTTVWQVASNKCIPKGRLMPCVRDQGGVQWAQDVNNLYKEFKMWLGVNDALTKPIKLIVQCWIRAVIAKGLYVHSGFGYAPSRKQEEYEDFIKLFRVGFLKEEVN